MKNVKKLVKSVKELGTKGKIILAASSSILVAGVVVGTLIINANKSTEFTFTPLSEEEKAKIESQVVDKSGEMSEESKKYQEQTNKFIELSTKCNELGIECPTEAPSEDDIDKVIEDLSSKIVAKQNESISKENKESASESSNQNSSNQIVNEKPVEQTVVSQPVTSQPVTSQPVASQPVVEQPTVSQPVQQPVASQPVVVEEPVASQPVVEEQPVQPSVPSIPSGWKDDVAQSLIDMNRTPNTNNTDINSMDVIMTPSQFSNLNSWAQQWLNGSLSESQFIANAASDSQKLYEGKPSRHLERITFDVSSFDGYNPDSLYMGAPGLHYRWCRVYYDASTNKTTVYSVAGYMSR